jgi:hypothetical protein
MGMRRRAVIYLGNEEEVDAGLGEAVVNHHAVTVLVENLRR